MLGGTEHKPCAGRGIRNGVGKGDVRVAYGMRLLIAVAVEIEYVAAGDIDESEYHAYTHCC